MSASQYGRGLGRRHLLKFGASVGIAGLAAVSARAATDTPKIALEEHFSLPEFEQRGLVARPTHNDAIFADIERRLVDFGDLRLAAMDSAGIEMSVLSLTTPGVQGEKDKAAAVRLARQANDVLAREVQKRPRRYGGFAAVPTQDPAAAADELQRAVNDLKFRGALINGQTNGRYLDDNAFLPFWERVQALDVPVYLHPGALSDAPAMFAGRPELEGPVWAWTADTGSHALRLVFSGLFQRFPRLRVILGHMGETLPYLLWRLDNRYELAVGRPLAPEERPSFILRRNFVITTSGVCDPIPLAEALAALGDDSVMFGVDYPYQDSKEAGAFIESAPLGDAVRAKVCNGNARRILRL
ncbi:MAG TPA: amidohydrolase family protein [Reyranella sp.]|nr:amidohydrolase family protein [Reyranella sp.]